MQYLIVGQHPPDLCPSANETVRKLSQEGAGQIPELAEKLGVKLLATYVPMNNHMVFAAVEADDMSHSPRVRVPIQARPVEHDRDLPDLDLGGGPHEGERIANDLRLTAVCFRRDS